MKGFYDLGISISDLGSLKNLILDKINLFNNKFDILNTIKSPI
jgi:hypothetical protein